MKIVVLDGHALNPGDLSWQPLEELGDCNFYERTSDDQEEIIRRIGDAEIVLTNKVAFDAKLINRLPNLKYLGVTATGYNVIDLVAAKNAGITVTNVPTYGTDAVAQFTFSLLLEITNQVGLHNKLVRQGEWVKSPDFTFWEKQLMELTGKTMGLVGYGRIGKRVAEIAHVFGMKVIFYNHRPKTDLPKWLKQVSLPELFQSSDVISLHVPQTPETTNLICEKTIKKMKDGVILLNTARGGLVNETDLTKALKDGKVAGAGVDVVSREPMDKNNPLLKAPNCFITPHIAWAPRETRNRLLDIVLNNLKAYLAGKPVNVVD